VRVKGLIVIPAFNEEARLPAVLERVRKSGVSEEVLVVNDGSADGTQRVIDELGVRHVKHPVNLGYAQALRTGIRYALDNGYDYAVFLDGDGQHDPGYVPDLRKAAYAESGADVVIGSRFVVDTGYHAPPARKLGMLLFSWVTGVVGGQRIYDTTSGFKLIKRRALELLAGQRFADFHSEMIVFILSAGLTVGEVPVKVAERESGTSMYDWKGALLYPLRTSVAIGNSWWAGRRERQRLRS
jgi:glycosyltransferase involved in cell wall biosynthesis